MHEAHVAVAIAHVDQRAQERCKRQQQVARRMQRLEPRGGDRAGADVDESAGPVPDRIGSQPRRLRRDLDHAPQNRDRAQEKGREIEPAHAAVGQRHEHGGEQADRQQQADEARRKAAGRAERNGRPCHARHQKVETELVDGGNEPGHQEARIRGERSYRGRRILDTAEPPGPCTTIHEGPLARSDAGRIPARCGRCLVNGARRAVEAGHACCDATDTALRYAGAAEGSARSRPCSVRPGAEGTTGTSRRRIAFFGHDSTESTIIKRVTAFQAQGCDVLGFMFRRARNGPVRTPTWDNVELGTTLDRHYLSRLPKLVWGAAKALRHGGP